jgi:hypothetical protein
MRLCNWLLKMLIGKRTIVHNVKVDRGMLIGPGQQDYFRNVSVDIGFREFSEHDVYEWFLPSAPAPCAFWIGKRDG